MSEGGNTVTMDRKSMGLPWDGTLSTKSGGMSYQMLDSADPAHELDVIKSILLREGYLARLQALAKKQNVPGLPLRTDLVDLIDLIRVAGVDVVEAVVKWRRGLVRACYHECCFCEHLPRAAAVDGREEIARST